MTNKTEFFELKKGDEVLFWDDSSEDIEIHRVQIVNPAYEQKHICEENPEGLVYYGIDLNEKENGENHVEIVTYFTFIEKVEEKDEDEEFENFLIAKNDRIDNAAYDLICAIVSPSEYEEDDEDDVVEWDMEHIGEVVDMVKSYLEGAGFKTCHPYYEENDQLGQSCRVPCSKSFSCENSSCKFKKKN